MPQLMPLWWKLFMFTNFLSLFMFFFVYLFLMELNFSLSLDLNFKVNKMIWLW